MFILDILFEQQLNSWSRGDGVRQRRWIRARGDAEEGEGRVGGGLVRARLSMPGCRLRAPCAALRPAQLRL